MTRRLLLLTSAPRRGSEVPPPPRRRAFDVRIRAGVADDLTIIGCDRNGDPIAELHVASGTHAAVMEPFQDLVLALDADKWRPKETF